MELIEGIKGRRSVRKYEEKPLPHELIADIVEAARFAPSWKNTQCVRYIVVEDKEKIQKIASDDCMLNFSFNVKTAGRAPAILLLCIEKGLSGYEKDGSFSTPKGDHWQTFDAGIAAEAFCLAAHAHGVGTVIMGIFDEAKLRQIVTLPENLEIAALIPMGFPAASSSAPPRKEVADLLSFQ